MCIIRILLNVTCLVMFECWIEFLDLNRALYNGRCIELHGYLCCSPSGLLLKYFVITVVMSNSWYASQNKLRITRLGVNGCLLSMLPNLWWVTGFFYFIFYHLSDILLIHTCVVEFANQIRNYADGVLLWMSKQLILNFTWLVYLWTITCSATVE